MNKCGQVFTVERAKMDTSAEKTELKILVVSDTHRNNLPLKEVIRQEEPFDMLIHCGDVECDIFTATGPNPPFAVYAVKGNCDFGRYPKELVIETPGHRIFVCHGHQYGIRYSREKLYAAARARETDVVLFGHTHVPEVGERNGLFLMNPGSLCEPRGADRIRTYGLLLLQEGSWPRMYIKKFTGGART